jgi:hypothetical protein
LAWFVAFCTSRKATSFQSSNLQVRSTRTSSDAKAPSRSEFTVPKLGT